MVSTASTIGDSYCSLAWGARLAELTDGRDSRPGTCRTTAPELTDRETALADWARRVVRDPNGTTAGDVTRLRDVGFDDPEIFEATAFIAFRVAFSTINDALGAAPDKQLAQEAPDAVRAVVNFGRASAA